MKILLYIRYFFFIAINWDPRLAWFTIKHEMRGEKKYGIDTTGTDKVEGVKVTKGILQHAQPYQGANYFLLESMFTFLKNEQQSKHIIDFGCGKGRILVVAAHYGFKQITGIEISDKLAEDAKQNTAAIQPVFPDTTFNIIKGNAVDMDIDSTECVFFFFNPFDEVIMLAVLKKMLESLKISDREIFVGYINPVHKELFLSAGFIEVFHLEKYHYLECSIFMHIPD